MYILNNDEILATKITVNRQDVEYVIQELYKFETEFEVRTEDELNKKYGSDFKILLNQLENLICVIKNYLRKQIIIFYLKI